VNGPREPAHTTSPLSDVLVIVDASADAPVRAEVVRRLRVTQRLPPRLFIASGTPDQVAEVVRLPGVSAVLDRGESPTPTLALNETERLYVDAWRSRGPRKDRPGDGQSWDAPGFTPPG